MRFLRFLGLSLALASVPSAWSGEGARRTRPNILFAIADDWSPHAGAYGTDWVKTPSFDTVAREGLLFRNGYTPNAKCAPSRACLLTGRNPWQLKEAANHICYFPAEFRGWGEALAANGWFVGHTQKGWGPGVAVDAEGTPRSMTGQPFNRRKAEPPTSGIAANDYAANFADFLEAVPGEQPWCFWYGALEPHRGYEFGSGVAKGGKRLEDIDQVPAFWPDNETIRHDMLDYALEVEHFDRHLGRMLSELEARGLLDNTLVIVTADHGMPFPRGKGNANPLANHVPFAVMWKGGVASPGRVIDDYVSFIDVAPTLMELVGLKWEQTGMAPPAGRSFAGILFSAKSGRVDPARDHVLIGRERNDVGRPHDQGYPVRGIIRDGEVFLENLEPTRWPAGNPETGYLDCDGGATKTAILEARRRDATDPFWNLCFGLRPALEYYDTGTDPDFVKNLADDPARREHVTRLRQRLHEALKAQGDPRMAGQGARFDQYEHATKANVGFHEKYLRGEPMKAGWVNPTDFEKAP